MDSKFRKPYIAVLRLNNWNCLFNFSLKQGTIIVGKLSLYNTLRNFSALKI